MTDVLASLKHEIHLLESRKLTLSHQLATLNATHTLPTSIDEDASSLPTDDTDLLANLFTRTQKHDLKALEKLHRLAGITLFIPNNPNEGSISQDGKPDEFLGIRFETMQQGKFEMPHYVILRKNMEEGETWVLHRHTIPNFIPLLEMAEEFLGQGVIGLEAFALGVHRHLILLSNRTELVSRMRALNVQEVKADAAVRLVEVTTVNWITKIVLLDKGERCVVVNHDNERLIDVEKEILRNKDMDIVDRISRVL